MDWKFEYKVYNPYEHREMVMYVEVSAESYDEALKLAKHKCHKKRMSELTLIE